MERRTTVFLGVFTALVVAVALVIGLFFGKVASLDCKSANAQKYKVTIKNDRPNFADIKGHLCDTVTFTNTDKETRVIAFGVHDAHVAYDGVSEKVLNQRQSFTITLNKAGKFHWHDHLHDEVEGYFTVTK